MLRAIIKLLPQFENRISPVNSSHPPFFPILLPPSPIKKTIKKPTVTPFFPVLRSFYKPPINFQRYPPRLFI